MAFEADEPVGDPPGRRRILLTGAAGAMGRCIAPALLARGHEVRGYDRAACANLTDHVTADLTDADALDRAMAGRDTLMHLAAHTNDAPFIESLLQPNVVGLYHVFATAKRHGVARIILSSSMQVVSGIRRSQKNDETNGTGPSSEAFSGGRTLTADDAAPTNDYALTKLWAEQLGAMAARTTDAQVLAVRIGWFIRDAAEAQRLQSYPNAHAIYLSPADTQRFFTAAVEADLTARPGSPGNPGLPHNFAILYATGPAPKNQPPAVDLEPARRWLGYEPQDPFPHGLPPECLPR